MNLQTTSQALSESSGGFFTPENVSQVLTVLSWTVAIAAIVWLVTSVIGALQRRAYNLTHAESGGSKKIRPDFLTVDKDKREAAIKRGERYDEELAKRERPAPQPGPVPEAGRWSRFAASAATLTCLGFTALSTVRLVGPTEDTVRSLGSWETFQKLASEHQIGAVVCVAVIASNAYLVISKLKK
jgi:hypothetical protein